MCAHITTEHLLTFFPLSGDDAVLFFRAHLLNDRCKFQCQFMKGGSHFCCDTLYLSLWKCGQAFSLFCPLYKNNVSVKVEFKNCCRYLFDGLCCQSAQHLKESRLKYLNSYWIDCCEILSRHPNDFVDPCFVFFLWHQENEMSNNFFVMMLHICHQVKICSLTLILIICSVWYVWFLCSVMQPSFKITSPNSWGLSWARTQSDNNAVQWWYRCFIEETNVDQDRQKDFSLQCCSYTYTWGNCSVQCCLNFQLILSWLLHLRSSSDHGPRCCLNRVLNKCTGQAGVAGWTMSWMWWTSAIHSMAESTRHLKWIWAANGCQQRVRSGCGWCGRTVWTRICATFQVSWLKQLGLVV